MTDQISQLPRSDIDNKITSLGSLSTATLNCNNPFLGNDILKLHLTTNVLETI